MKSKIQRMIAREGLILLGVILAGTFLFFWVYFQNGSRFMESIFETWKVDVFYIAIPFYTIYLIIRFVRWAFKILKEEK